MISSHETTKQDYTRDIRTREHTDRRNSLRKFSKEKIKPMRTGISGMVKLAQQRVHAHGSFTTGAREIPGSSRAASVAQT